MSNDERLGTLFAYGLTTVAGIQGPRWARRPVLRSPAEMFALSLGALAGMNLAATGSHR